jgi:hypothetical protein
MHIKDSETMDDTTTGVLTRRSEQAVGPSQEVPRQDADSTPPTDAADTITASGVNAETEAHASLISPEAFEKRSGLALSLRKSAITRFKIDESIVEQYYLRKYQGDADRNNHDAAKSRMNDLSGLIEDYDLFDLE